MRAEHVTAWLWGAVEEEDPAGQGNGGKGANWELFVQLVRLFAYELVINHKNNE
jgi:hypothetical protein